MFTIFKKSSLRGLLLALGILVPGLVSAQFSTPVRVPSFGPNGSHWPGQISGLETPFMYDDSVPNQIEVDPSWSAISDAINGLTAAQVAAGVLIKVRPGTMTGRGSGGGDPQTLDSLGDKTWTKRVTVCPRDGFGTVTINNGVRFKRIRNICFAGFIYNGKLRVVSSTRFAFAWSLINGRTKVEGVTADEGNPTQWEFVEWVFRQSDKDPEDPMQMQSFPNLGKHIKDVVLDGIYLAPCYLPVGSKAHQDTIQHLGFSGNAFQDETIRDCAIFASADSAVNGGLRDTVFQNCWISGNLSYQSARYPLHGGAEMGDYPAINNGTVGNITFDGGIYLGRLRSNQGIDDTPYDTVINGAKIDSAPTGYRAPTSGEWVVDSTMDGHTNPGLPTEPSDSYLQSIWRKGAVPPTGSTTIQPLFFPSGGVYDTPQDVSIASATPDAIIRYTTDGTEPTSSSPTYGGTPIPVSSDTTIKAYASKEDLDDSLVNSATYEIRVVAPVITPGGRDFLLPTLVEMSTTTQGADIFYTLDGSTPTSASSKYPSGISSSGISGILIQSSATVKAIAIRSGLPSSEVSEASFVIGGGTHSMTNDWGNFGIPANTETFEIAWDCVPSATDLDSVVGVGPEIAEDYSDLACIVRFAPWGIVDARDGSGYQAVSPLSYSAGARYRVQMSVDVASKRYSATVTPEGGSSVVIAENFAFRSEHSQLDEISNFAFVLLGPGGMTIQNISMGPEVYERLGSPGPLRVLQQPGS